MCSFDARNREFPRRPSYFCHSAAWEGKEREERPGLVTTAHGTPTMKRWSFDVRSCDQARPPRQYDPEANREEITWT